jgi:hypothetical protein
MKQPFPQPKSISELIDTLDRIREELLIIQKSLERVDEGKGEDSANKILPNRIR